MGPEKRGGANWGIWAWAHGRVRSPPIALHWQGGGAAGEPRRQGSRGELSLGLRSLPLPLPHQATAEGGREVSIQQSRQTDETSKG